MQEKPWHSEFGVAQAVLTQEQLIGYLTGKVIEQFARWQSTKNLTELEDSQEYLIRLIYEIKAQKDGRESLSYLAQSMFEYFLEKRLMEADATKIDQNKKEAKNSGTN